LAEGLDAVTLSTLMQMAVCHIVLWCGQQ